MKRRSVLAAFLIVPVITAWPFVEDKWICSKQTGYSILYSSGDSLHFEEYLDLFETGVKTVSEFFQSSFSAEFDIYIHPDRSSLDSTWQRDWNLPGFESQCWMVASGVAHRMDILSPAEWDRLACEHSYTDIIETQGLITHELVHVFHGQRNGSPDFSVVNGIDWFIEGLAVYASGQCDSVRISDVREAITKDEIPGNLENFWSGDLRYGLSGTLVMYLDITYGRQKLMSLLEHTHIETLLDALETTEAGILNGWKSMLNTPG